MMKRTFLFLIIILALSGCHTQKKPAPESKKQSDTSGQIQTVTSGLTAVDTGKFVKADTKSADKSDTINPDTKSKTDTGSEGTHSIAELRRQQWLTGEFRCRAISTVRLRKCRFKIDGNKTVLKFKNDVSCTGVEFDKTGNPSKLTGCSSSWLKIPRTVRLKKGKNQNIWSGSHHGWFWKNDKKKYCCPGIWLEGP
jgi:hypothetical protein